MVNPRGIEEKYRKFPYYLTGPGKPKKETKKKPMPKDQFKHPEQLKYDTFNKLKMREAKGKDGIQHWGFERRWIYQPKLAKKSEKKKTIELPKAKGKK